MARYLIVLDISDGFYREAAEQGTGQAALIEELKGNIEDLLDEYDLNNLVACMTHTPSPGNLMVLVPKKAGERPITLE